VSRNVFLTRHIQTVSTWMFRLAPSRRAVLICHIRQKDAEAISCDVKPAAFPLV
jgi:hypothetical protein